MGWKKFLAVNTGGLCMKVEITFETQPSGLYRGGLWIQVVT